MTDAYQVQVVSPGKTHTGKHGFTYRASQPKQ